MVVTIAQAKFQAEHLGMAFGGLRVENQVYRPAVRATAASGRGCVKTIAAIHESKVPQPASSYGDSEIVLRSSN
jgi:hypothetical protein